MITAPALAENATLTGERVRLRQLDESCVDDYLPMLRDRESARLTGSRGEFDEDAVRAWLRSRPGRDDRADWAIVDRQAGTFLGEAVLNDLSTPDASMNFRIILAGQHVYGRGYGTEATRLVVAYGFDVVGLHRISLTVFAFNPRARRAYEKAGFVREGVARDALYWDGAWHDDVHMAILATDPRG